MKKFIYLLLLCVLFSCKKEIPAPVVNEAGVKLYSKLSNVTDVESKKIMFGLLSPIEKYDLWKARFADEIKSGKFSKSQVEAIEKISELISPDFFMKGDKKEIFKSITLPNWIKDNNNIFSKEEIFNLLFNIADFKKQSSVITKTPGNSTMSFAADCFCAVGSNWTCYMGAFLWGVCSKTTTPCDRLSTGCGALIDDECDGNRCSIEGAPEWPNI